MKENLKVLFFYFYFFFASILVWHNKMLTSYKYFIHLNVTKLVQSELFSYVTKKKLNICDTKRQKQMNLNQTKPQSDGNPPSTLQPCKHIMWLSLTHCSLNPGRVDHLYTFFVQWTPEKYTEAIKKHCQARHFRKKPKNRFFADKNVINSLFSNLNDNLKAANNWEVSLIPL